MHVKSNLGERASSESFRIETGDGGGMEMPKLVDRGEVTVTAEEALAAPTGSSEGIKFKRAKEILREELADGEWHETSGVRDRARAAGISFPTVRRATDALRVEKSKGGFPARTQWRMPRESAVSSNKLRPLGESPEASVGSEKDELTGPEASVGSSVGSEKDELTGPEASVGSSVGYEKDELTRAGSVSGLISGLRRG